MKAYWISAALLLAVAPAMPVVAQDYGGDQAAASELRHALERLARTPTDSDALLDAGNAALVLRDYSSALGFFSRAEALQPSNGRVKAGLATAMLFSENPVEALRMFDAAVSLGVSERAIAADRGLAFDLVGNNAAAQAQYALGSTAVTTDDLIIRQAVSYGLAGDQARSDALLNPLLTRNEPAAWRARAFVLASKGDLEEATRIVRGFLDVRSTAAMRSYLERMDRLTNAQQAAVIHYGHFPAEEQIGRDSDAVRAIVSRGYAARAATGTQDRGLIPSGQPLGRQARLDSGRAEAAEARAARVSRRNPSPNAPVGTRVGGSFPVVAVAEKTSATVSSAAPTARDVTSSAELPAISAPVAAASISAPAASAAVPPVQQPVRQAASAPAVRAPMIAPTGVSSAMEIAVAPPVGPSAAAQNAVASASPSGLPSPGFSSLKNVRIGEASDYDPPASANSDSGSASPAVLVASSATGSASNPGAATANVPSLERIVSSIQIPPQEKQPNAFAVDLERIAQYQAAKPLDPLPSPFAQKALPAEAKPLAGSASPSRAGRGTEKLAEKPPTKSVAKPAAKPGPSAAPVQSARNWVQIATGAGDVMKSEYRRLSRGKTDLFAKRKGWTSAWKTQQRLLVGPFDSLTDARGWLADYEKLGGAGFAWNSEDGTAVDPLP